jgi:hypothetical protein
MASSIPNEIIGLIVQYLDQRDIFRLRLVGHWGLAWFNVAKMYFKFDFVTTHIHGEQSGHKMINDEALLVIKGAHRVRLFGQRNITGQGLVHLANSIEEIDIGAFNAVNMAYLNSKVIRLEFIQLPIQLNSNYMANCKILILRYVIIDDEALSCIGTYTNVEQIELIGIGPITDIGMATLVKVRYLKTMFCPRVAGRYLSALVGLERLSMDNVQAGVDFGLVLSRLKQVELNNLDGVQSLERVEKIKLSGPQIYNNSILQLKKVKYLTLKKTNVKPMALFGISGQIVYIPPPTWPRPVGPLPNYAELRYSSFRHIPFYFRHLK